MQRALVAAEQRGQRHSVRFAACFIRQLIGLVRFLARLGHRRQGIRRLLIDEGGSTLFGAGRKRGDVRQRCAGGASRTAVKR